MVQWDYRRFAYPFIVLYILNLRAGMAQASAKLQQVFAHGI